MSERDIALQKAEAHVKMVRDFLYHLMTYLFVCVLLVIFDLGADTGGSAVLGLDWAYWVILGWGLGVAGHAIYVFVGERRVEKLAEEYLETELTRH